MATWRPHLDAMIGPAPVPRPKLEGARWPELVRRLLALVKEPTSVREILHATAQADPKGTANHVLRALEIVLAGRMLLRLPARG